MEKTKSEFIINLLNDKKISFPEKQKLLSLTQNELKRLENYDDSILKKLENNDEQILKKLKEIEEKLDLNKHTINQHNPKGTVEILKLFETKFKYLTHEWDNSNVEFNRTEYLENEIFPIFNKEIANNKELPKELKTRIWAFIKKTKPKDGKDHIWFVNPLFGKPFYSKYGWSSVEFIKWYDNAINKSIIDTPNIKENMIDPFKNSIQIRTETLFQHIEPFRKSILNKFDVKPFNLDSAKFYTDVQNLIEAIKTIFKCIDEEAKKNDRYKVDIYYKEEGDYKIIEIVHKESTCQLFGDLKNFGGNFNSIKEKLKSLCNWSVEAIFKDGNKRINLLWDIDLPEVEVLDYTPIGFTHKLYFLK